MKAFLHLILFSLFCLNLAQNKNCLAADPHPYLEDMFGVQTMDSGSETELEEDAQVIFETPSLRAMGCKKSSKNFCVFWVEAKHDIPVGHPLGSYEGLIDIKKNIEERYSQDSNAKTEMAKTRIVETAPFSKMGSYARTTPEFQASFYIDPSDSCYDEQVLKFIPQSMPEVGYHTANVFLQTCFPISYAAQDPKEKEFPLLFVRALRNIQKGEHIYLDYNFKPNEDFFKKFDENISEKSSLYSVSETPELYKKTSTIPNAGSGAFAREKLKKGQLIGVYLGDSKSRKATRNKKKNVGFYTATTHIPKPKDIQDSFFHLLNNSSKKNAMIAFDVDATLPTYDKFMTKFINHDTERVNAEFVTSFPANYKVPLILVYATKDINKDEEIFLNYGERYSKQIAENLANSRPQENVRIIERVTGTKRKVLDNHEEIPQKKIREEIQKEQENPEEKTKEVLFTLEKKLEKVINNLNLTDKTNIDRARTPHEEIVYEKFYNEIINYLKICQDYPVNLENQIIGAVYFSLGYLNTFYHPKRTIKAVHMNYRKAANLYENADAAYNLGVYYLDQKNFKTIITDEERICHTKEWSYKALELGAPRAAKTLFIIFDQEAESLLASLNLASLNHENLKKLIDLQKEMVTFINKLKLSYKFDSTRFFTQEELDEMKYSLGQVSYKLSLYLRDNEREKMEDYAIKVLTPLKEKDLYALAHLSDIELLRISREVFEVQKRFNKKNEIIKSLIDILDNNNHLEGSEECLKVIFEHYLSYLEIDNAKNILSKFLDSPHASEVEKKDLEKQFEEFHTAWTQL